MSYQRIACLSTDVVETLYLLGVEVERWVARGR